MNTPTILAIVVLGYLMLKHYSAGDLGSNLADQTPPTTPPSPTPPAQIILPDVTASQLQAQVPGVTVTSSDGWCWAFFKATNVLCPSDSVIGPSMTADQFIAALQTYKSTGATQQVPAYSAPAPGHTRAGIFQTGGGVTVPGTSSAPGSPINPHLRGVGAGPVVDLYRMKGSGKWTM